MVSCDHCHRKFSSYSALEQHYNRRHASSKKPLGLSERVVEERRATLASRPATYAHKGSRAKIAVFLLVIVLAVALVGYVLMTPPQAVKKSVDVGSVAPDFSLPDTQGGTFTLSQFKGRSDVLLFFNEGLACSPCLQQMSNLDQLNQQFVAMNITVASITTDQMSQLVSWSQASGPRYSRVLDDQTLSVSRAYDMLGSSMHPGMVPGHTFLLIDKTGMVTWRHDYYPPSMYVEDSQLLADVKQAVGA